jgi:hypothetical protein
MATFCRAYMTEDDAHAAVDRVLAAGIADADVRILTGEMRRDARDAPAGSYAGADAPAGEAVGAYAGASHSRREAMGAFAGDANGQRRGGFADADRETVTMYRDGVERMRVASHHDLKAVLLEAGLDEGTADADVAALHEGRVLVLVMSETAAADLAAALDG